jgi:hypothetical protein
MNTTLKSLTTDINDEFGDELCAAITSGLAKNTTLEEVELEGIIPSGDDGALLARNALSFLSTNTTLKFLGVSFAGVLKESNTSAFRLEAGRMMKENSFLDRLSIATDCNIKVGELFALVSALQRHTTLKTLDYAGYG